jgi:hypothetical protein
MMRFIATSLLGLALAAVPDLTGTWVLDSVRVVRGEPLACAAPAARSASERTNAALRLAPICAERLVITRTAKSMMVEHTSAMTPKPYITAFRENGGTFTADGAPPVGFDEIVYQARWSDTSLTVDQLTAALAPAKARNPVTDPRLATEPLNGRPTTNPAPDVALWPDATLTYKLDASGSALTLQIQRGQSRIERTFKREAK